MSSRPLFALIIGIDDYTEKTELRKLKGAVADADRVQHWIRTKFNGARIRSLRNSEANRGAIIEELQDLSINPAIERNDPILIFYAGHGIEGDAPKEWRWDSQKIQMIAPWDYCRSDNSGRSVEGIPDFTLGVLLRRIADNKGDNITVIFDCCHSGSGTRSDSDTRVRGGPHLGAIPPDLDQDLLDYDVTRGVRVQDKFRHHGSSSHVLLAACASNEEAREHGSSGAFTRVLLKVLDNEYTNTAEMTYKGLIDSIELLPRQTPQCEGNNRNRFLFDRKLSSQKPIYSANLKDGQLTIIGAGACRGTTVGSTFAVWGRGEDVRNPPLDTVVVDIVRPHESRAPFNKPVSSRYLIAQIRKNPIPQLSIHLPENSKIRNIKGFEGMMSGPEDRSPLNIIITKDKASASIGLTYLDERKEIGFELLNPAERRQKICHTIPASATGDLHEALRRLCHYYYHLNRVNKSPPSVGAEDRAPFSSKFAIELVRLKEDEDGKYVERPGGNVNIAAAGIELVIGPANEEDSYGLRIVNNTNFPVFPYLFYFDSSTFSITSIYEPVAAARAEAGDSTTASLRANGFLTIGYGSGGGKPQTFTISNWDLFQEQGYLRLFVSGKPVDLSHLEQEAISISEQTRGMKPSAKPEHSTVWDAITIPVILKREEMIGIIGPRKNGRSVFIDQLFDLLDGKKILETSLKKDSRIKEYNITLPVPERSFVLVDLPSFQGPDLEDNTAVLEEIVEYLGKQYNSGRRFKSLVWCYNISKSNRFTAIDGLNVDLVKDIAGPSGLKNLMVLTTDWNTGARAGTNLAAGTRTVAGMASPLHRYEAMENYLKSRFDGAESKRLGMFNPLDSAGKERMLGSASAEDPLKLVRSLLSKDTQPKKLQMQHEVLKTKTVGGTTAGKRLRDRFKAEIKKKEDLIQTLDTKIRKLDEQDGRRLGIQGERRGAELDIAGWKKCLKLIDSKELNLEG